MKNKKFKGLSRAVISRLLCAILLLGILGGVLTSCAAGTTKATKLKKGDVVFVEGSDMTVAEVESLATKITEHKDALMIREKLVAAQNGYDITGANYEKKIEELSPADTSKSAEYAVKVLREYGLTVPEGSVAADVETNSETGSATETDVVTESVAETDAASATETNTTRVLLNEQALAMLINCFRVEVEVEASRGVLDQLLNWIGIGFGWLIDVPGFGSFILGTLYFAIALELLMLPLGIRQQKNSIKQAKLRPREMAIRNKYRGRNDQATMMKLNEEIRTLYASEGYSPMSGCLPLLITLPFLLFLYYIVLDPMVYMMGISKDMAGAFLDYASAHPAAGGLGLSIGSSRGTIEVLSYIREGALSVDGLSDFAFFSNGQACYDAVKDALSNIPDFSIFKINMGATPSITGGAPVLLLIPVATFLVYWGSGKITRKMTFQPMQGANDPAQGCSNGMMNIMMPAMSAWFTFMVPAAIGIYWMFKSIVATVKQIVLAKVMPLPVFTEEDYKAAERELAGKDKNKPHKKSGTRNPNVRSLHHIDDEDYETSAPARVSGKNKPDYVEPEDVTEEKPRTADNAYSEGVTLKEDRPAKKDTDENKKDEE